MDYRRGRQLCDESRRRYFFFVLAAVTGGAVVAGAGAWTTSTALPVGRTSTQGRPGRSGIGLPAASTY
jgi:hypothetical protein